MIRLAAAVRGFNERLADRITTKVGTVACAYLFGGIALVALPGAVKTHNPVVIVVWLSSSFLQLVLLPVIIVGQNRQGSKTEALIRETHDAAMEILSDAREMVADVHEMHFPEQYEPEGDT